MALTNVFVLLKMILNYKSTSRQQFGISVLQLTPSSETRKILILAMVVLEYKLEEPGLTCQEFEVLVAEEESCVHFILLKSAASSHSG